jgi:PKD repeat protein
VTRTLTIALSGTPNSAAPTPSFTVSPEAPTLQQPVVFDASATQDEGRVCNDECTYTWDFGGESTTTGRVVTYRFQAVRTYPVTLTVRDAAGSSASLTRNVVVAEGAAPTASFTFSPSSPGQFENVFFSAAASRAAVPGRSIVRYDWRFGDGATATGVNVSHAYNVLGTYPVVLTVTDSAGVQSTTTQSVVVVNGVTSAFTASPTNPTTADFVVFDAEASRGSSNGFGGRNPIVEYIWDFGDHNRPGTVTTTNRIAQHRYSDPRTYTINLTVVDSAGRRATTAQTLTVLGGGVTAAFTVSPTNPRTNETVRFDPRSSTAPFGVTVVEYLWDFGNGLTQVTEPGQPVATTTYSQARIYTVRLTVVDSQGGRTSTTQTVTVTAP